MIWASCRKEPLQFTGKTGVIDFRYDPQNGSIDKNCNALNAADFPPTGDAAGRIVVNGRAALPDGSFKPKVKLWLFNALTVIAQTETDANGRFKFDVSADTAAASYYYVVFDPFGELKLIPRYNCQSSSTILRGRIQNLDITTCEAAQVRLKVAQTTDADSVQIVGTYAFACDKQPSGFGFPKQKMMSTIDFFKQYTAGYSLRAVRGTDVQISVFRYKNGTQTSVSQSFNATNIDQEIVISL